LVQEICRIMLSYSSHILRGLETEHCKTFNHFRQNKQHVGKLIKGLVLIF